MDEAEEFERLIASLERYEQADPEEVDDDEYLRLMGRYEELRRKGHGPQPHWLDEDDG